MQASSCSEFSKNGMTGHPVGGPGSSPSLPLDQSRGLPGTGPGANASANASALLALLALPGLAPKQGAPACKPVDEHVLHHVPYLVCQL